MKKLQLPEQIWSEATIGCAFPTDESGSKSTNSSSAFTRTSQVADEESSPTFPASGCPRIDCPLSVIGGIELFVHIFLNEQTCFRKEGMKEGKKEGSKEGRKEGGKKEERNKKNKEVRKEGRKEERKEGKKEGKKAGRKEGKKERKKERRMERRKKVRKEGRNGAREKGDISPNYPSFFIFLLFIVHIVGSVKSGHIGFTCSFNSIWWTLFV